MSRARRWPPRLPCFVPRLGEYLGRLEQQPMSALLERPHTLARALRRASTLFELEVECLEVPAAWLAADEGLRLAVREGLRTLRAQNQADAPATLIAMPSPATLARATATDPEGARSLLQAFLRLLGEIDVLAGVMLDGDDGAAALGGILGHYGMTAICVRRSGDVTPVPAGVWGAHALSMAELAGAATRTSALLTTDGPVDPAVAPEELLAVSRTVARANERKT